MNPYEILEINPNASEEEIRKIYRKKCFENHPDRGGNPEKFKQVQQAYDQLTKKKNEPQHGFNPFDMFNFGDIFNMHGFGFNHGFKRNEPRNILHVEITIDFLESAKGCKKPVEITRNLHCNTCNGTGGDTETCNQCHGSGMMTYQQGHMRISTTCNRCNGEKIIIKAPCSNCNGNKVIQETSTIIVDIPEGVGNNKLRISDIGKNQDLIISVSVEPHKLFHRENNDVLIVLPISYTEAFFGAKVQILTLEGLEDIEILPQSKSGDVVRLKNKGILSNGLKGDFLVQLEISFNEFENERIQRLLKELQDLEKDNPSKKRKDFNELINDVFNVSIKKDF